jgi:non-lysosomal glucosylceramidase
VKRRNFIKQSSLLSAGLFISRLPVPGNAFSSIQKMNEGIPLDKGLDPKWIKSLYTRGGVTTYLQSKNELQYIGMPVGGINCGTVYLGGDGRLWLWDIFNKNQEGIEPKTIKWSEDGKDFRDILSRDGACYVQPAKDIRPLEQGFAFKIETNGTTVIKKLEAGDWDDISFEATYPSATIRYHDAKLPVEIKLEAYSPFIALDAFNSGLPCTVFSFHIKNTSNRPVNISLLGWLENKSAIESAKEGVHERYNTSFSQKKFNGVEGSVRTIKGSSFELQQLPDFGSLSIASLNEGANAINAVEWPLTGSSFGTNNNNEAVKNINEKLIAGVADNFQLLPGKSIQSNFVISWHFANLKFNGIQGSGRFYQTKFNNSAAVALYVHQEFKKLAAQTALWKQTWYDSSLPWWFMERTFSNISTLATTTCHRFTSGRFWAWEGVGSCPGNCTHVWQYAQAVGRVFPALEKDTRQRIDLGLSLLADGGISFRAESETRPAIDGQAGTVLRFYREHQMSADDSFLVMNWEKIKKTIQFLISQDKNGDGMEDTPMENTLDAVWDGEISWIVGLCIAAVKAGQCMAEEMNDKPFAALCKSYVEKGRMNMEEKLFNGEYFIHQPDPVSGRKKLGSYNTSHIDQVMGQSWAFQVGLGRILDKEKTCSALRSLWKYNFTKDVGPYIKDHKGGRPYALAGDGGMIMNANPKNEVKPYGEEVTWQGGYFNECMSGFEHQVASHLMAEGMTDEAMVLTRIIHDRYHASKRNPFNEIECSDHYARAMASYGTFITACGFEYHGPKKYIRFGPTLSADNFRAPFVSAEGWGSYSQQRKGNSFTSKLELKYGQLELQKIGVLISSHAAKAMVKLGDRVIPCHIEQSGDEVIINLVEPVRIGTNESLVAHLNLLGFDNKPDKNISNKT